MNELLGISISHGEQVFPNNEQYSIFFDFLRLFDWRTQPINKELTAEVLAQYKNILIGEPHSTFSHIEIKSLQNWINNGGNILIIASCSGDSAPSGNANAKSNIGQLLEVVNLLDNSLGINKGVKSGIPFDTKVIVDITHLTGFEGKLCYDTGCTMKMINNHNITIEHALYAPYDSSCITGLRLFQKKITAVANSVPRKTKDLIFLKYKLGLGSVSVIGSSFAFKNDTIIRESNAQFANWLIVKSFNTILENYIHEHEQKPQRHRLLHGYPFPNLMHKLTGEKQLADISNGISISKDKPYIIGILPHTFCNPMVQGCGFCTFPHESYNKSDLTNTVRNVLNEIGTFHSKYKDLFQGKVKSVYFGGGTANLTPSKLFEELCHTLCSTNDCSEAETTLEGVPKYFAIENYKYLDILQTYFNNKKLRLSLGIQTFNETLLTKMGRQNFGDTSCIRNLANETQRRGIENSGDLLFDLPNQTIEMMKSDVMGLIEMNFNQISIYHLVMFRALGPEWSKDKSILDSLPDNSLALSNWLNLRELLLSQGYEQRTLTNFQKNNTHAFEYEECVFQPESYNWVGFGPSAISAFYDDNFDRAVKFINPETANEYNSNHDKYYWDKYFVFDKLDLKVLYITRKIALLAIDKKHYRKIFASEIEHDFAGELYYLSEKELVKVNPENITITPKGMFYADTVAGLFALRNLKYNRMLNLIKGKSQMPEEYYTRAYSIGNFNFDALPDFDSSYFNRMG